MGLYKVTVATGSELTAGTIDTIAISLVGVNGESAKQELSHLWLPGTVSDYEVKTKQDLGELLYVRLYKETYLFPVQDAWYGKYVNVTSPNGKLYQFPVYKWINGQTSAEFPEGKGIIFSMGFNNAIMDQRVKDLKNSREIYKWKSFYEGAPWCLDADTTEDLPINEKYSDHKIGSHGFNYILSVLNVRLKGLTTSTDSWRNLDDIRTVFYFNRTDISDKVSKIWREDSFFGYQFLNGVNPMQIRKCEKLPENFPVSNSMVAASLGTSTDLTEELKEGNIFLADYKILQGIPANPSINGKKQYITAPLCLLWKDPKDQLLPIAIQLGQTPGEQTPIFLPNDPEWDWTLAKMWVRNAEFQVHQSVHHLLNTHLIAEVFSIATHRQLPRSHPVYKLIHPHLRYTLFINTIARKDLFGPGGIFDQVMVVGNGGTEILFRKAMEQVTYTDLCFPDDIEARGLTTVPNFYYRDDGKMIWGAVESFVSSIVRYYYSGDESVQKDPELQAWVAEIYEKGFLSNKSSGIPSSLDTVPSLVKYLTMVIFRCSAQHAAVNSNQFDFYGWMPNGPTSMKSPPPTTKGVTTLQTILNTLPDVNITTTGVVIVWQISNESKDQRRLGDYPDVLFTEETPKKYIKEFQEKLAEISRKITKRNQTLSFPYPYLDPKKIDNSVSI